MPRTPDPGTRERILDVASRLFYTHGVRAIGTQQVVAEAGTGKNLLYQHFPTKDDLVAAYLARARERVERAADAAVAAAGDDPGDQLVALVAEVGAQVRRRDFRGCAFRNLLAEFPGEESAPVAVARAMVQHSRGRVDELVARLGAADPREVAERLWLVVDGLYVQAAYRDRLDGARDAAVDTAVGLARRIVDDARR
ncbi:TetR/AcrR family transcriptional regulator [Actinomycetospora lemnae]|uniref:TetR/AcrR family transcriptional regulator n=1 Tax=Actinomycetospora lemnae TaxID=3019891 RepID=A0ABT5STM8_9PSEU|nr:TetR/AcrR family transcriptional regulator [Actinomycetospora sp. DW7H6]MDD7965387.1 TetR/AcrR family transcriptional regulator [Actinomycetospora sp. DW7H6]